MDTTIHEYFPYTYKRSAYIKCSCYLISVCDAILEKLLEISDF